MQYQCKQDEVLDAICYRYYGSEDYLEIVLNANPHLAGYPPHLPIGLLIELPEIKKATTTRQTTQLWD